MSSPPLRIKPQAIPLLLVTGFLGSGKTTLINRFLQLPNVGKLGVVINEFGQIGIDGALLGPGDILELGGGCVCCATGTELWESVLALIEKAGASHVIIETSGIAEIETLLKQYEHLPAPWKLQLDLRSTLCLVDVLHLKETLQTRHEAVHQIKAADLVLLTKIDAATPFQIEQAHALLDQHHATKERASFSKHSPLTDTASIFAGAFGKQTKRTTSPEHHVHPQGQLATFAWQGEPLLEAPLRDLFSQMAPPHLLRAKGFVWLHSASIFAAELPNSSVPDLSFPEPSLFILQWAMGTLDLTPATPEQASQAPKGSTLVFIGQNLEETWLRLRLSACEVG